MEKPIWIPKSCLVFFDEFKKDLGYDDYYSTIKFAEQYEITLVVEKDVDRTNPEDGEVYLCCGLPTYDINGEISECADQMYFDKIKIDALKSGKEIIPQLHWKATSQNVQAPSEASPDHWISCDTLPSRWKCSPFDVVEAIEKKGLLGRLNAFSPEISLEHKTLDNFSVHSRDLAGFEELNTKYLSASPYLRMVAKAEAVLGKSSLMPSEAIAGLLERLEAQGKENTSPQAKGHVHAAKAPATVKDYSARMPGIVKAVLDVKKVWDDKDSGGLIRQCGFSEKELLNIAPNIKNKTLRKSFKYALNDCGIKVHLDRKPRIIPKS